MTDSLQALYETVYAALVNASGVWGNRVYAEMAQTGAVRPYALFVYSGGGERNIRRRLSDPEYLLNIKVVAEERADAMTGAAQLAACLDDKGFTDVENGYLDHTDWWIVATELGQRIHITEMVDRAMPLYHQGATFRFVMEEKQS